MQSRALNISSERTTWVSLILFLITWILVSSLFYIIMVLPFFPDSLSMPTPESQNAYGGNYVFAMLVQISSLFGAMGTFIILVKRRGGSIYHFLAQQLSQFNLSQFSKGVLTSICIIGGFLTIVLATGLVSVTFNSLKNIIVSSLFFIIVSITEEIVFRGYVFVKLQEKLSLTFSLIFSSLLFSVIHIANPNIGFIGFINIFLFGSFTAILYHRYQNLSSAIGAHFAWNFLQTFFGFAVSGQDYEGAFVVKYLSAKEFLTGGAFGVEGSLLLILPMIIIIMFEFKYVRQVNG